MQKHYIDIDGYWGVLLVYEFSLLEIDEIADIMINFGVSSAEMRYAMRVLYGINGGMTISRPDVSMSVVFIGEASSIEQFFDTLAHELDHVQDTIDEVYGVEQGSEESAWLQGYLMRGVSKWLKKDGYICPETSFR